LGIYNLKADFLFLTTRQNIFGQNGYGLKY
jgi:hypothetical protein